MVNDPKAWQQTLMSCLLSMLVLKRHAIVRWCVVLRWLVCRCDSFVCWRELLHLRMKVRKLPLQSIWKGHNNCCCHAAWARPNMVGMTIYGCDQYKQMHTCSVKWSPWDQELYMPLYTAVLTGISSHSRTGTSECSCWKSCHYHIPYS